MVPMRMRRRATWRRRWRAGVWGAGRGIGEENPKSETRNPKQGKIRKET
jgi:hypothetical protein